MRSMDTDGLADQAETRGRPGDPERGAGSRPETEFMPLDRFQGFTDGVLAIVITLLVLELTVPAVEEPLLRALAEEAHEYLGYVISFVFVGAIWVAHAGMTKLMREADAIGLRHQPADAAVRGRAAVRDEPDGHAPPRSGQQRSRSSSTASTCSWHRSP